MGLIELMAESAVLVRKERGQNHKPNAAKTTRAAIRVSSTWGFGL